MRATDDILRDMGLGLPDEQAPGVAAECIRIARRLREAGRRVVGLVPATGADPVPPVALRIGQALVDLTGATIAYVDANVHEPALAEVSARPATSGEENSVYATRWLSGTLALLAPRTVESAGAVVPQLARVLSDGASLFEHILVDLTGFDRLGEHAAAASLMDGVIVVARAGKTKESMLLSLQRTLGVERMLGVLLVG